MFKRASVEDEVLQGMVKNLTLNASEKSFGFEKISKAIDYMNSAADLFDDVGMHKEAEALTKILEKLASKK